MDENDLNVTQVGEVWGRFVHRKLSVERCENGYVVKYSVPSGGSDEWNKVSEKRKVFITNSDLLEFIESYFEGEPKP